eukprot:tig00020943_g16260.t1
MAFAVPLASALCGSSAALAAGTSSAPTAFCPLGAQRQAIPCKHVRQHSFAPANADDVLRAKRFFGGSRAGPRHAAPRMRRPNRRPAHGRDGFGALGRVCVRASADEVATVKKELLSIVAGTNRGFLVSDEQTRKQIDEKITRLEAMNPTPAPTEEPGIELLKGNWRLVYTNSLDVVLLARIPALQLGEVFQSYDGQTLTNVAELSGLPPFDALSGTSSTFSVDASVEAVSPVRLQVAFQRAKLTPGKVLGRPLSFLPPLQVPISSSAGNQNTYLDTTFLDEDMRIGRGVGTSVFVLTRVEGGMGSSASSAAASAPQEITIE